MKNIKILAAAVAFATGIMGVFAFDSKPPATTPRVNVWYNYTGGSVSSTSSYAQIPAGPNCMGSNALCAISLPDAAGTQPSSSDLTASFVQHIQDVVNQKNTQSSDVKLKN